MVALYASLLLGVLAQGPGPAPKPPPKFPCDEGCDCCCMHCDGPNYDKPANFKCMSDDECQSAGGQCKSNRTSHFVRGEPSELLWLEASEGAEQVHLVGGYPDEVSLIWMSSKPMPVEVTVRTPGGKDEKVHKGKRETYTYHNNPHGGNGWAPMHPEFQPCPPNKAGCIYTSDILHVVDIKDLAGGTSYEYRLPGEKSWRKFKTPPAVGQPITFGVTADLGQTRDSQRTLEHMKQLADKGEMDNVLIPGDVAYADGWAPSWDSFGRVVEPLMSTIPTALGGGDHEFDGDGTGSWTHFEKRFGWRSKARSDSDSFLWYSFEAGLAHVTMLCSFCDFEAGSYQHDWLLKDLQTVDRSRTPWLIVAFHIPFYTTSVAHPGAGHSMDEADAMRRAMEKVLLDNQVDIILDGHIHMYERTYPVFDLAKRCDGPVHIMVGDGGNREGPACPWNKTQPEWSAFREFSFGHGVLSLPDATHAVWRWHRNQDNMKEMGKAADEVKIPRASDRCSQEGLLL